MDRVVPDGKHLRAGSTPFRVKGVTYGHFVPRTDGHRFPEPPQVERDLTAIAAHGLNTLRTYSVPPLDLLDGARALGLRLLVGVDYADWRMRPEVSRAGHRQVLADGRTAVRQALEVLAGRPEVLAVSVGNEVPSDIARLYGRAAVEDTLSALVAEVHAGDPELPATYTSYPTSEFLRVDGQDIATFNVFLESADKLAPYLHHLQRVTEDRPLVITELGLAAELHGDDEQARSLDMQLGLVDAAGCAGATIFAWTDEWAVHTEPVLGWGFGLTRVDRSPRPALAVAEGWARRSLRDTRTDLAVRHGGRLRLQRGAAHRRLPGLAGRGAVPGPAGPGVRRRLHGPHARAGPAQRVRGARPGPRRAECRTERRPGRREGRDRRLPGRGRRLSSRLALPSRARVRGPGGRGRGRAQPAVALGRARGACGRALPRQPRRGAGRRRPGRARPGLQPGGPPVGARRHRRVRRGLHHRRGRRRRLLAAAGPRRTDRVLVLPRRSTTIAATRCVGTCVSSAATAGPSACSPATTGTGSTGWARRGGPASCTAARGSFPGC